MSLNNIPLAILKETAFSKVFLSQTNLHSQHNSTNLPVSTQTNSSVTKGRCYNSRSSDSGKSSSSSPILLDCSFDSGIAGVLLDDNDMQLHKRIQQYECILLALERDQEYFLTIRNRLSKISNRKQKQSNENECFCNVCCAEIDPNDEKTYVKCYVCKKYICRSAKCSDWLSEIAEWECELCQTSKDSLAQTSSWVADQITFNQEKIICPPRARSEVYIPISEYNDSLIHFESVSQTGANSCATTAEQKIKIREYVEEVVAKLLGGNLDTVAVTQMSKSENYLNLFHKYHSKLSNILINLESVLNCNEGDLPGAKVKNIQNGTSQEGVSVQSNSHEFSEISETRLRQMIQKIIAETMSLPPVTNGDAVSEIALDRSVRRMDNSHLSNSGSNQRHRTEHYFEPTIYQDLLATAVLNKIVDKQLQNIQNPSEKQTVTGDDDLNDNIRDVSSDQNMNMEKLSTSSGSSVEPRSDCSYPEEEQAFNNNDDRSSELLRNSDRDSVISDYLANHMIPLPDLNAIATESEEDDYTSVTSSALGDGTWEKNWLFKKKKSALSGSVTTSSIGMLVPDPKEDIRAQIGDKTADEVSDLSELGSDSDDSLNSLRSQLEPINDRLINKHLIGGQNSKMILDEIIERSSMISNSVPNDAEPIYTDACNENVMDAKTKNEAINDNVNQQNEFSNEQKVDSKVLKDLNSNSLTGSIAEREYKKWYNAVEMPNNPYAPEALQRRISGSQERFIDLPNISPTKDLNPLNLLSEPTIGVDEDLKPENDYKRYSRDYYINSGVTTPQVSPARDLSAHTIKENRESSKTTTSSTKAETENCVYKAIPVQVVETNTTGLETTSPTPTEAQAFPISISEDSDTIKFGETEKPQHGTTQPDNINIEENAAKAESTGNVMGAARGTTPVAFKFLQPKRKLLEPNQVLTLDEEEPNVASSQLEKVVIEEEVVKALPSVKALARAFLMTSNKTQPEKIWLRKTKTLSQGGKKRAASPKRSLDVAMLQRHKPEDDMTISSDLSSLETDSSSMGAEFASTSNYTTPAATSSIDPSNEDPVRQGVLKNNIAFFENLKNK